MNQVQTAAAGGESFAALFEESLKNADMRVGEVISAEVVRIAFNLTMPDETVFRGSAAEMAADIRAAAARDQIDATLDYKAVAKRVAAFVEESRFQLVETLAEKIAGLFVVGAIYLALVSLATWGLTHLEDAVSIPGFERVRR